MSRVIVLTESQIKYTVYDSVEEAVAKHENDWDDTYIVVPIRLDEAKLITVETRKIVAPYEPR